MIPYTHDTRATGNGDLFEILTTLIELIPFHESQKFSCQVFPKADSDAAKIPCGEMQACKVTVEKQKWSRDHVTLHASQMVFGRLVIVLGLRIVLRLWP
jgi:hypothetical protein